ncbi:glycoside hydrolase family 43 protein [Tunicatimonas pelagia]|uniref:glycoside hydrolase family 43 protein n=1 Tax=Tunicatimonas pelagia TaxID=931531 RepID=UPI00266591BF|nr:glycoside hydrolase family 43 protein [Tunicatimonas pelagia]WKN44010.1 glycoside hydrolase family 43 protein [Tunicatimonas pelagia]
MRNTNLLLPTAVLLVLSYATLSCQSSGSGEANTEEATEASADSVTEKQFLTAPLVSHIYTADPSAHVFNDTLYVYPSHDVESGIAADDLGSQFDMQDYHVFSMAEVGDNVTDHGAALSVDDVLWAERQMWAPDAAYRNGTYYLYFPAKDEENIFRIGVATSSAPTGPFAPQDEPIEGSFSIDPAVFEDTDGAYYMYFGGIWGGQLQRWESGEYVAVDEYPADDQPAISAKVARLADDMLSFDEKPKDVVILDENGEPLVAGDNERRFFEAAWVHKYQGTYYFSYSTGDTHYIAYATGDNPYGPFTYQGVVLNPVLGWTNHHSVVKFNEKWYLFYHDTELSDGQTHLRNIKVTELTHRPDGSIETITP